MAPALHPQIAAMVVREIMTSEPASCHQDDRLDVAARMMWERNIGFVPVVDDWEQVVGTVTDRDIAMAAYLNEVPLRDIAVRKVMVPKVASISPDETIETAARLMQQHRVRRLPVVNYAGKLLGVVSLNDLALKGAAVVDVARTLTEVCRARTAA